MIKFFRKIRQQLLVENKISKYLLYAIGEIVLVVIGILIALSINNWNTNLVERNTEKEYMQSMLTDLEKDKSILNNKIEFGPIPIIYNDSLFVELQKRPLQGREKRIYHFLLLFTTEIDISYHDRTISQLRNSGGFRLVQNKKVSDALMDYDMYMRESIKYVESSGSTNLVNNDILINYNIYEIYRVQHLKESAIAHKNEMSKVAYPDNLKLLSYDELDIKLALNSMAYVRQSDAYKYERALFAFSLNRQLASLIRKEYFLE